MYTPTVLFIRRVKLLDMDRDSSEFVWGNVGQPQDGQRVYDTPTVLGVSSFWIWIEIPLSSYEAIMFKAWTASGQLWTDNFTWTVSF